MSSFGPGRLFFGDLLRGGAGHGRAQAERGEELANISRQRLQLITPKLIPNSVNGVKSLQVEITYCPEDPTVDSKTVLLGLQLTVQPENLLGALITWKDGAADDPDELLDRIEQILRGEVRFDESATSG